MARRSYEDACPSAYALDLIGERWALLVVRELLLGPKRFADLAAGLNGIGASVLSTRLKELESVGVIERRRLPPPTSTWAYELTEFGRELEDIVLSLARWGARAPGFSPGQAQRADDALFAAKASFRNADRDASPQTVELRLGEALFELRLEERLEVRRGEARHPDLVLATDPQTLVDLLFGAVSAAEAIASGAATTTSPVSALEGFFTRFDSILPPAVTNPKASADQNQPPKTQTRQPKRERNER